MGMLRRMGVHPYCGSAAVRAAGVVAWILAVTAGTMAAGAVAGGAAMAAEPPPVLNYQGVLRDAAGAPRDGSFDMVFRFFDAAALGNEILIDSHVALLRNAVTVTGGLFNVQLGTGRVSDGGAVLPNDPYTSLGQVFRDFPAVYVEVQIGGETLAPRVRVVSAAYALNADHLDGRDASEYLDTSASAQTKAGSLALNALTLQNQITIAGGAPGAGRVLTSNASGLASWQDLPATQANQLRDLGDRLGGEDPSDLPFATLRSFDCSGTNTATLVFEANGSSLGSVTGFVGVDRISEPFEYLVAIERSDTTLKPESLVGGDGRLTLSRVGGQTTFTGLITEFGLAGFANGVATYVARLEPHLAKLARNSGYQTFSNATASDILLQLLNAEGLTADIETTQRVIEHAVRYEETPFEFFNRVAEGEGLHYHFSENPTGRERLSIKSTNAGFTDTTHAFNYYGDLQDPGTGEEFIATFHERRQTYTDAATVTGWNYAAKTTIAAGASDPDAGTGEFLESFADVSSTDLATTRARVAVGREQARRFGHSGTSNVAEIKAGHRFTLTDQTASGFGDTYIVTAIRHYAVSDPARSCVSYGNAFSAHPASKEFAAPRRSHPPNVPGPVRAVVTNNQDPEGLGRVKVKFTGDPTGTAESAWARVVQPPYWKDERDLIPEIEDEVLVAFAHGDMQVPIVLGSLHNGVDRPPADGGEIFMDWDGPGGCARLGGCGPGPFPDYTQSINFFDDGLKDGESLSWNDMLDRFEFTNDVEATGLIAGGAILGASLDVGPGALRGGLLDVTGNIKSGSLDVAGLVKSTSLAVAGPGQFSTLSASGQISGGSIITSGSLVAGSGSFTGSVVLAGDLQVGGGDIIGSALNLAAPTVTLLADEARVTGNNLVRTMIDGDNTSTLDLAAWYHDGSFASTSKLAELQENGNLRIRGQLTQAVSFDLAESFRANEPVRPGDVVRLDPRAPGAVRLSEGAGDPLAIGVVSGRPGMLLGGATFDAASLRSVWGEEIAALYHGHRPRLREEVLAEHAELRRALAEISPAEASPIQSVLEDGPPAGAATAGLEIEDRIESKCLEKFYEEQFTAVALAGRVLVNVDASFGVIEPGDPLTPSPVPGVAMKASGPGLSIGTSLERLTAGRGQVLAFVDRGQRLPAIEGAPTSTTAPAPSTQASGAIAQTPRASEAGEPAAVTPLAGDDAPYTIRRAGGTTDIPGAELLRVDAAGNVYARGAFHPASMDLAEYFALSEPASAGDVVTVDPERPGRYALARRAHDPAVVGIVSAEPGVVLGGGDARIASADPRLAAELEQARALGDKARADQVWAALKARFEETHAPIALSGTVPCRVDAGYGSIVPGDLLTTSATPGHARRADALVPGTIIGKALEPLAAGMGTIRVLVMMR